MIRRAVLIFLFLFTLSLIIYSCQDAGRLQQDIYYTNGRDLYIKNCQNCHGENGEGLAGLSPALTDTMFLKVQKSNIACFIKQGLETEIIVNGKKYQEKMPAFPNLAVIDITQIIVYISNNFGNKQGHYTTEQVAEDLKRCSKH